VPSGTKAGAAVSSGLDFGGSGNHTAAMKRLSRERRSLLLVAGLAALLAIAVPVIAADPSPAPPGQQNKPDKPDKPAKAAKEAKGPEVDLTLTGTVTKSTDEKGRPTYTITVDGVAWELSTGPKWFKGANDALEAQVGKSVQVSGKHHEGDHELDVATINGQAVRAEAKPPWAGGPSVVGASHPGYKSWKAAKDQAKATAKGRESAPGQLKDKTGTDEGG
jgi:hypothetical protein